MTSQGLRDIWGSSGSDVFAVGEGAAILHYDGSHWATMPSGASGFLGGVWGSSGSDVYAVGVGDGDVGGLLLHYDGSSWSAATPDKHPNLSGIWGSSGQDIFAVGRSPVGIGATVLHYDGIRWSEMSAGPYGVSAIWGSSGSDVYAVGDAIVHYDGQSWTNVAMPYGTGGAYRDVWGSSSSDVYAVGKGVLHYDGVKWDGVSIPTDWPYYDFTAVWGSGSDDVFVAGSAYGWTSNPPANLQKLWHYDGTTWSAMSYPGSVPSAGWANSAIDVFAVGGTSILHYPESATHPLLRVAKDGSGTGTVTSDPSGIACGPTCSALFPAGTVVTLAASADAGTLFAGWSGACTGMGPCVITMDGAKAVTATFNVEGSVMPQGSMMYYGGQLETRQDLAASAVPTTTHLAVFTGAPPPGLYLVGVEGSEPYPEPTQLSGSSTACCARAATAAPAALSTAHTTARPANAPILSLRS